MLCVYIRVNMCAHVCVISRRETSYCVCVCVCIQVCMCVFVCVFDARKEACAQEANRHGTHYLPEEAKAHCW